MKYIVASSIFMASSLFANYAYQGSNSGNIDMHGGNSDKLIKNQKNFSNDAFNSLGGLGISKPNTPKKPEIIVPVKKKELEKTPTK